MLNTNLVGNPMIWTRQDSNHPQPFEKSVAAVLAVPKAEADAEEAARPKRAKP